MAGTALASAPSLQPPPPPPSGEAAPPQQAQQADPIEQFRQVLQQFGSFHTHPLYGQVWKPSDQVAPRGWSPYPVCHWQYDRDQRTWVFNDPTEWGSIVHRHGRWANDPQYGWVWVADANAGPGWVMWRNDERSVSWAPMLPEQHGNQPPRDGWQVQDQVAFNSGCRNPAPSPMAAERRAMINEAPMPMVGPGGSGYSSGYGGGFSSGFGGGGGGAIFVPGRPVFVPRHPPVVGGHLPPSCSTGIRPSWCRPVCATHPSTPGCHKPGPVIGGMHLPPGATPGPLGSLCARFPATPACRPTARPHHFGQFQPPSHRPHHFGQFQTPSHRPHHFGQIQRPSHRPHYAARPQHHRPFAGNFGGGHRSSMGHRSFGQRFARR